jgi:hypothetical protein
VTRGLNCKGKVSKRTDILEREIKEILDFALLVEMEEKV